MALPDPRDTELDEYVANTILKGLLDTALAAAGGAVEGSVRTWWQNYYRAKFFYAIRMKCKEYGDKEKAALTGKAEELGERARSIAGLGMVTPLHAAMASFEVDCPPVGNMEDWCN